MKSEPIFKLWRNTSKAGKKYFTGYDNNGNKVIAFYGNLKNEKRPAMKIYSRAVIDDTTNANPPELLALWLRKSKGGKQYLSGKFGETWVVGFINTQAEENKPYINVYEQLPIDNTKATKAEPRNTKAADVDTPF